MAEKSSPAPQTTVDQASKARRFSRLTQGRKYRSYPMIHRVCLTIVLGTLSASAQWLHYPTPGIPRTPDGKPNLAAAVPKTADGKPDLSGLWQRQLAPNQRADILMIGPN